VVEKNGWYLVAIMHPYREASTEEKREPGCTCRRVYYPGNHICFDGSGREGQIVDLLRERPCNPRLFACILCR
jgi:hypothetical protein